MSQFHYGSIKTKKKARIEKIDDNSLNSTMVRLKQIWNLLMAKNLKSLSQFHYGSIKTGVKTMQILTKKESLNSTMVRLKLC